MAAELAKERISASEDDADIVETDLAVPPLVSPGKETSGRLSSAQVCSLGALFSLADILNLE